MSGIRLVLFTARELSSPHGQCPHIPKHCVAASGRRKRFLASMGGSDSFGSSRHVPKAWTHGTAPRCRRSPRGPPWTSLAVADSAEPAAIEHTHTEEPRPHRGACGRSGDKGLKLLIPCNIRRNGVIFGLRDHARIGLLEFINPVRIHTRWHSGRCGPCGAGLGGRRRRGSAGVRRSAPRGHETVRRQSCQVRHAIHG